MNPENIETCLLSINFLPTKPDPIATRIIPAACYAPRVITIAKVAMATARITPGECGCMERIHSGWMEMVMAGAVNDVTWQAAY